MSLWLALGLSTVLYLAALQTVPLELEQAARIDGANYLQRLRHVVFPLISPVVFYQVLIAVIYALGVAAEPLLLGPVEPRRVSRVSRTTTSSSTSTQSSRCSRTSDLAMLLRFFG